MYTVRPSHRVLVGRLLGDCTSGNGIEGVNSSLQFLSLASDAKMVTMGFWSEEEGPAGTGVKGSCEKTSGLLPEGHGIDPSRSSTWSAKTVIDGSVGKSTPVLVVNVSDEHRESGPRRRRRTTVAHLFQGKEIITCQPLRLTAAIESKDFY